MKRNYSFIKKEIKFLIAIFRLNTIRFGTRIRYTCPWKWECTR